MAVDKDLFLHDLAVVAILKNEGHYLKEWLDYHLLAGVDHFYLYDNESPDNQTEVAKPYIAAGLVDYFPTVGKVMQMIVYNDAVKRFKFQCRYMAFIDGDEFIYPKNNLSIVETADEILSRAPNAAGLAINWQIFGSSGQEKANYSRGVLDRFTRRAPKDWMPDKMGNAHIKTIANPRMINYLFIPHCAFYFEPLNAVNENGDVVNGAFNIPITAEKIVVNHYHTKSREEYRIKVNRGRADTSFNTYDDEEFKRLDCNDEFDDGILKYRDARAKVYKQPDKSHADERLFSALAKNLSPTLLPNTPQDFYAGKLETFLTCRAVASYLKEKLTDDTPAKFFEEAALKAILQSMKTTTFAESRLLMSELPNLLLLPYPAVVELRKACLKIIPQMMSVAHLHAMWKDYTDLDYLQRFLKIFWE